MRAPAPPSDGEASPSYRDLGALGYADSYAADGSDWTGVRDYGDAGGGSQTDLGPFVFSSGHEAAAWILHVDGELERRWALDAHPENASVVPTFAHATQPAWRRIEPLPDGGLLAVHEGLCLLRLDAASRIVWSGIPGAHHDVQRLDERQAVALDRAPRRAADVAPGVRARTEWIVDDGIVRFDLATGRVLQRVSLLELLVQSRWSSLAARGIERAKTLDLGDDRSTLDPLHANALLVAAPSQALDASEREILVLLRDVGALVTVRLVPGPTVDPDATPRAAQGGGWTARITSVRSGPFIGAHDPQWAAEPPAARPAQDRPLVLFDNHGDRARSGPPMSRVLQVDGSQVTTLFEGSASFPFHSEVCGALEPLPGGGWLVTETTAGRAFQLDRAGEVTWEFRSPFRIPAQGPKSESSPGWVAALLDMRRLPAPR